MILIVEKDILCGYGAYLDTSNWISWKYSKMGHFPTRNNFYFKKFGVFQTKLVKIHVTNDTFSWNIYI